LAFTAFQATAPRYFRAALAAARSIRSSQRLIQRGTTLYRSTLKISSEEGHT
jgi:hypothetical protein